MHITIARIKTFASVSKETSPILVTRVLSKGKLNTDKKTFTSPSKNTARMEKKKKKIMAIAKVFALHANAKRKQKQKN